MIILDMGNLPFILGGPALAFCSRDWRNLYIRVVLYTKSGCAHIPKHSLLRLASVSHV